MELASVRPKTEGASESVLISQLGKGDPQALAAAYDRHSRSVYSLVLRMTRDKQATEELVHELFVRLWNCSRRGDSLNGNLGVWLLRTARGMALAHVRALPIEIAQLLSAGEEMHRIGAAPACEQPEFQALLLTLNAEQRQVLELAYFQGCSRTEIAAMLTQPLETVKLWVNSALGHLRGGLKAQDNECV